MAAPYDRPPSVARHSRRSVNLLMARRAARVTMSLSKRGGAAWTPPSTTNITIFGFRPSESSARSRRSRSACLPFILVFVVIPDAFSVDWGCVGRGGLNRTAGDTYVSVVRRLRHRRLVRCARCDDDCQRGRQAEARARYPICVVQRVDARRSRRGGLDRAPSLLSSRLAASGRTRPSAARRRGPSRRWQP